MTSQTSAVVPQSADRSAAATQREEWWRGAVIYQVYPRSFADSDGDGIGDLPGIRERLPYLRRLGVDAVWLSPFYASPQADAGYDVADYRRVDPVFGTLDDARELLDEAHGLGLRVIVDLVPNHCSDQHEWFQQALREGPGSPMRERFHFRPGQGDDGELPPNDWQSVFGGSAWDRVTEPDGTPGEWYLHLFAPQQPDFDWQHETVREEFRSVLRFWLDLGVDGFRIDVAHGMVKAPGLPDVGGRTEVQLLDNRELPFFDQDGVHEIYHDWRAILDSYPGERIGVAEAWTSTVARSARYLRPGELHQAFNFSYLTTDWDADALRTVITDSLEAMAAVGAPATWVLSNHDVVRHSTRLSGGDAAVAVPRARAATLLMLGLPGSVYVYQGEELGLPEVTELPAGVRQDPAFFRGDGQSGLRDGCRVPLPWSGERAPYGFGPAGDGPSWLPQPESWAKLSVAAQTGDPDSTLEFYRSALAVRRAEPALGAGESVTWLDAPAGVLAFRRDADGGSVVCAVNVGGTPAVLPSYGRLLLASGPLAVDPDEAEVTLPADTGAWWAV
ncbi:glycoside hydrolase family 13 protein [Streptomyces sp. SL13]|uniref:Glycoside hydrolase family 13 protein n=1 Tax=Streptantibioticus silvisoli TaxID=2705255 RepID=A0AA90H3P8_9ACTN|nr:glycoside hydrolase family 13 protein [Streptantibioticus silvisoli]MDI5961661.1 glycoside hydrolase family 13 protein [Streptantibioticus silvisoli]MDI5968240.1 glycoside hydrolase family 13 protein [Streptantibioticus silvisoli]